MSFFNGSLSAQNLQLGLDDSNLITTKIGALRLQSSGEEGQIEIGNSNNNIPQMTITKDGVVIESNLVVKGQQTSVTVESLLVKDTNIELGYGVYPIFKINTEMIASNWSRLNTYQVKLHDNTYSTIADGNVDISAVVVFDHEKNADEYVSYQTDNATFINTHPGYDPNTEISQSNIYTNLNWLAVNVNVGGVYKWGHIQNVYNINETLLNDSQIDGGGITLKSNSVGSENAYGTTGQDKKIVYDRKTASWKPSEHLALKKNKRMYSLDESGTLDVNGVHLQPGYGRMFIQQNASNDITTLTGRVTDITNHSITELKSYKTLVLYVDNGRTDDYSISTQYDNTDVNVLPWGSSISEITGNSTYGQNGRNGTQMRPYKTIGQAITAANNNKYKYVIIVKNGVYTEAVTITNKDLTIQGESREGVIIQTNENPLGLSINNGVVSKNKSDVFTINASGKSVVLKNMTVRHGDYGIYSTAGNVTVDSCRVYRNGYDGQAIGNHVNSLSSIQTFRNSHMHSLQTGGGIYIQSSNRTDIKSCLVYENSIGIQMNSCTSCNVNDNDIHDNMKVGVYMSAPAGGSGQIGCYDCMVFNNNIENNKSNGVLTEAGSGLRVYNNNIYNNWGAGYVTKSSVEETLENNILRNNNLRSYNGSGYEDTLALGTIVVSGVKATSGGSFGVHILENKILETNVGNNPLNKKIGVNILSSVNGQYNEDNHNFKVSNNTFSGHDSNDNTTSSDIVNDSSGFALQEYGNLLSTNSAVFNGLQCSTLALDVQNIVDANANISINQAITMIKRSVTGTQEIIIPSGPSSESGIYQQGIQKHIFFDNTNVPVAQRSGAITLINFTYKEGGVVKKGLTNGDVGASKIKFNGSGQSVTLIFVDNKWKIINSGALIVP